MQMQRHRVVDLRADPVGGEEGAQLIPAEGAHHVLVIDVEGLGPCLQQADRGLGIHSQSRQS